MINKETWLDPSLEEACSASGTLVLSCMPALTSITSVWQTGRVTPKEVLTVSNPALLVDIRKELIIIFLILVSQYLPKSM